MRTINTISLLVHDYDKAIEFYTEKLGFQLLEDTAIPGSDKRRVVVSPCRPDSAPTEAAVVGRTGANLLLARASDEQQANAVGNQAGGRVFLFLNTNDFWRDHTSMINAGVTFNEVPREEAYGIVAVFQDLYGNLWDLIQHHWKMIKLSCCHPHEDADRVADCYPVPSSIRIRMMIMSADNARRIPLICKPFSVSKDAIPRSTPEIERIPA